jgi:hypothetical protein
MTDRRQVTVSVDAATYEEWAAAAERDYEDIEDLVRTAVAREIAGEHDATFSDLLERLRNPYE